MAKNLLIAVMCMVGMLQAQSPVARSAFEVAAIKLSTGDGRSREVNANSGGRFGVSNFPLKTVIEMAFNVKDFQIAGGPAWIDSDGYDFNAKAATNATFEEMKPMIESLLSDRFKLVVHRETKELPIYDLVVAKGGVKLAAPKEGNCVTHEPNTPYPPPTGGSRPLFCGNVRSGRGSFDGAKISISMLVGNLSDILGRPINDKTGLSGTFDIHLEFATDDAIANTIVAGRTEGEKPPQADSPARSILTALQEQLGLRLESSKGPVGVLVIDHVERPSGN